MKQQSAKFANGKVDRIRELKESEKICKVLVKHFSREVIQKEIVIINEKIQLLLDQKQDIYNTRLIPSVGKLIELNACIAANRKEIFKASSGEGILAKYIKAVKIAKETEKILQEV